MAIQRLSGSDLMKLQQSNPNLGYRDLNSGATFGEFGAPKKRPEGVLGLLDTLGAGFLNPIAQASSGFAERGRMNVAGSQPANAPAYVDDARFQEIKNNSGLTELKDVLGLGSYAIGGGASSLGGAVLKGAAGGALGGFGASREGEELSSTAQGAGLGGVLGGGLYTAGKGINALKNKFGNKTNPGPAAPGIIDDPKLVDLSGDPSLYTDDAFKQARAAAIKQDPSNAFKISGNKYNQEANFITQQMQSGNLTPDQGATKFADLLGKMPASDKYKDAIKKTAEMTVGDDLLKKASTKTFDQLLGESNTPNIFNAEKFDIKQLNPLQKDAVRRRFEELGIAPNLKDISPDQIGEATDNFINQYMSAARSYDLGVNKNDFGKMFKKLGEDRNNLVDIATKSQKNLIDPTDFKRQASSLAADVSQPATNINKTADTFLDSKFSEYVKRGYDKTTGAPTTAGMKLSDVYQIIKDKNLQDAALRVNASDVQVKPELAAQAALWNQANKIMKDNVPGYSDINRVYGPLYNQLENVATKAQQRIIDTGAPKTIQSDLRNLIMQKGFTRAEGIAGDVLAKIKGQGGNVSGSFGETLAMPKSISNVVGGAADSLGNVLQPVANLTQPIMNQFGQSPIPGAVAGQLPRMLGSMNAQANQPQTINYNPSFQSSGGNPSSMFGGQSQMNIPTQGMGGGFAQGGMPSQAGGMGFNPQDIQQKLAMGAMTGAISPEVANQYMSLLGSIAPKENKLTAGQQDKLASAESAIQGLNDLENTIRSNEDQFGRHQIGKRLGDSLGGVFADPKREEIKTAIQFEIAKIVNSLSGAGVSDKEREMYTQMLPTTDDGVESAYGKLKSVRDRMITDLQSKLGRYGTQ